MMRGTTYTQAIAVIERDRAAIVSSASALPSAVLANIDFALAFVHGDHGELDRAVALLDITAPILLASTQSIERRAYVIAYMSHVAIAVGRHVQAEILLEERMALRNAIGEGALPFAAFEWAYRALNLTMAGEYDRAETSLAAAPDFGNIGSVPEAGSSYSRVLPNERARIRLARGDATGAARLLPVLPDNAPADEESFFPERALHGEVQCATGETARGMAALRESIRTIAKFQSDSDPGLARLRAVAGLCALTVRDRRTAHMLAQQSRSAFTSQPRVSHYFKAPLLKLEQALGLRLPPV
jgi:hypothetical protein